MKFNLLYPERRTVSENEIIVWYTDAVADGVIEPVNQFVHDGNDVVGMAYALMDNGLITIAKP